MNPTLLNSVARRFGTPVFVLDEKSLLQNLEEFKKMVRPIRGELFYALKANPRLAVLRLLRKHGVGVEAVSGGEVRVALKAGYHGKEILFNGNGKTPEEVGWAVRNGVAWFNFDSQDQLDLLNRVGKRQGRVLQTLIRVKPEVPRATHPHLSVGEKGSKFGFMRKEIPRVLEQARKLGWVRLAGVHTHFGSQILSVAPFLQAARFSREVFEEIRREGFPMEALNLGGGFGIPYRETDSPFDVETLSRGYRKILAGFKGRVLFEPGRFLVGNAGKILSRVVSVKEGPGGRFLVLDAGMTENIRPALYGARHRIIAVHLDSDEGLGVSGWGLVQNESKVETPKSKIQNLKYNVVGPVCENSDGFGRFRLPRMRVGDLALIMDSGAYSSSMASTYNSRPRPAEVLIRKGKAQLIRKRDSIESLWEGET
ncbi:MAG: diaminopimelate decarboxylase [Elusimicrobia bacterium]|nr:diaminopimelate decarboxylase [Elusimicrobiota bacterium]